MLKLILYIVILLLVLSFFGVSLQHVVESPTAQANFGYVWTLVANAWNSLITEISTFVSGIWNSVF